MQFLILGLLLDGPHSLYDVHKRFTGGISLFYAASFGSIQRALKQLEEHGRVTVEKAKRFPAQKEALQQYCAGTRSVASMDALADHRVGC